MIDCFSKDAETFLVYGKCRSVGMSRMEINIPPPEIKLKTILNSGNKIFQPASFYRTKAVKEVGYLDSSLYCWMEYDLFIKLLKKGQAKYIDHILANFTLRDDQKSNSKNRLKNDKEIRIISRRYGGRFFSRILFSNLYHRLIHSIK